MSKKYQLHLEQASITTFTGSNVYFKYNVPEIWEAVRQRNTNFAGDSKHSLRETWEQKNTFIALSRHLIPISDLLKTIFAIATDCLWHVRLVGDRDISQPLQCSLGLNYRCWRQTGKILCCYHFQNKGWFERCNFWSKELFLLHLSLECAPCLFMLRVLSWFCSVQDKI